MSIRLSEKEALVLALLGDNSELFGREIVERSNKAISVYSIYPLLASMQDKGLITARHESLAAGEVRIPRTLYKKAAIDAALIVEVKA